MKKTAIAAILIMVLLAASSICAGQEFRRQGELMFAGTFGAYDDSASVLSALKKTSMEIGPEVFYHRYEEPHDITEEGVFIGIVINAYNHVETLTHPKDASSPQSWMVGFETEFAIGHVDYDGQTMGGTPLTMNDIDDLLADVRILSGPDTVDGDRVSTVFLGLGYRYLRDDSSDYAAGYLRESNYLYLPIGLRSQSYAINEWSLGGTLEFDVLLFGRQESTISDIEINNDQDRGYGFRASLSLTKRGEKTSFTLQPFIRYWNIDESEVDEEIGIFVEPENETLQAGLQLLWAF